jgi:hypothetical protein
MAAPLSVGFENANDLIRRFNALDRKVQRQIINKAGLPILKDIRQSARRYIISAFRGMNRSGKNVRVNMAEGLGFKRSMRRGIASISLSVMYRAAKTNRLSHLIEWGFLNRRSGRRVRGNLMMTKAFEEHKQAAIDRFKVELARMLDQAEGGMRVS